MYVYVKEDNYINKYNILYNIDKLIELKNKVVNNCCYLIRCKEESINPNLIKSNNEYEVMNLTYKEKEGVDRFFYIEHEFEVQYDKLVYNNLVKLIDLFLNNDIHALKALNEYKIENTSNYLRFKIDDLSKEIDLIPNNNVKEKKEKLDKLESLLQEAKENENLDSTKVYFEELKSLISIQLVDKMDIKNYLHALDFLNNNGVKLENLDSICKIKKYIK